MHEDNIRKPDWFIETRKQVREILARAEPNELKEQRIVSLIIHERAEMIKDPTNAEGDGGVIDLADEVINGE